MKFLAASLIVIACGVIYFLLSTPEERSNAKARIGNATSALTGGDKYAEVEKETPLIVKRRQCLERVRRNNEWTPENQREYPIEYCQDMLDELAKKNSELEVLIHKVLVSKSKLTRIYDDEAQKVEKVKSFLENAKKAYREAEENNKWPMTVSGYTLSKEKGQEKIVEAANYIKNFQDRDKEMVFKNQISKHETKIEKLRQEQRKLAELRKRVDETINNLQTDQVIKSESNISATLNSLNDSINSLAGEENDVSMDELIEPTKADKIQQQFDSIMKN